MSTFLFFFVLQQPGNQSENSGRRCWDKMRGVAAVGVCTLKFNVRVSRAPAGKAAEFICAVDARRGRKKNKNPIASSKLQLPSVNTGCCCLKLKPEREEEKLLVRGTHQQPLSGITVASSCAAGGGGGWGLGVGAAVVGLLCGSLFVFHPWRLFPRLPVSSLLHIVSFATFFFFDSAATRLGS